MLIKAILFDKDGTIFDFHKTWGEWFYNCIDELALNDTQLRDKVLLKVNFDIKNKIFKKNSSFIAGTLDETVDQIITFFPDFNKKQLSDWFKDKSYDTKPILIEGAPKLLENLTRSGILLGVVTNDLETTAHHQLKLSKIHHYFSFILGSDSGFGFKPQTGMQNEFMRVTKIDPKHIIMVGDSDADMISGKNSGMHCIGVLTGPASRNDLEPLSNAVIETICDIPKYLKTIN